MLNKTNRILLLIVGLDGILSFVSHALFYNLFGWEKSLTCLNRFDWSIFMTYHLIMLLVFATQTTAFLAFRSEMTTTSLGKVLLLFTALLNFVRIAAEFLFFGYAGASSLTVVVLALLPACACLFVFFSTWRKPVLQAQR